VPEGKIILQNEIDEGRNGERRKERRRKEGIV
jgi:hypothetical protein